MLRGVRCGTCRSTMLRGTAAVALLVACLAEEAGELECPSPPANTPKQVRELVDWVESSEHLAHWAPLLRKEEIDLDTLMSVSDESLRAAGLTLGAMTQLRRCADTILKNSSGPRQLRRHVQLSSSGTGLQQAPDANMDAGAWPFASAGMDVVTEAEVMEVQKRWSAAIVGISKAHKKGKDFVNVAAEAAAELYAYGHYDVLFKPTKAAEYPFRPTPGEAMSYFVGSKNVDRGYEEDGGFAINNGKGWAKVVYENHNIVTKGEVAIAMGIYYFTCDTTGDVSEVEYTFGYQRCEDGKVRIFLHHSSIPFNASIL